MHSVTESTSVKHLLYLIALSLAAPCSGADLFGFAVCALGDVDHDSVPDYAIGDPLSSVDGHGEVGKVWIVSGKSREAILGIEGDTAGARFGSMLASVGDVSGDTFTDFAVGSCPYGASESATIKILCGVSGEVLCKFLVPVSDPKSPWIYRAHAPQVVALDDLDGDGHVDFAVGVPLDPADRESTGALDVYSGASGARIKRLLIGLPGERLGVSLAALDDLDGDKVADIAVGTMPLEDQVASRAPTVRIVSGQTGAVLLRLDAPEQSETFGATLETFADLDGDGWRDLIVGSPYSTMRSVRCFSVRSGRLISSWKSRARAFGYVIRALPDIGGGEGPDLLVTGPMDVSLFLGDVAWILSGSADSVIHACGSTYELRDGLGLSAAVVEADGGRKPYVLLGGVSIGGSKSIPGKVGIFSTATGTCKGVLMRQFLQD